MNTAIDLESISNQDEPIKEAFVIDNARWKAYYAQKLKEIQDQNNNRTAFLSERLLDYFNTIPHKETATQESYSLPSGKLVLTKPTIDYDRDEAELLPWAKKTNDKDFVRRTEAPAWDVIKKHIRETGEIPDGVIPIEKPGEFKVR